MIKKTIGLNPLEEYLSAQKNPKKEPDKVEEEPEKKVAEKQNESSTNERITVAPKPEAYEVPVVQTQDFFSEDVEIDMQGQLAIKGTKIPEERIERSAKQRITLHISTELVDRVKNAVYWEPGLTVAGFAEEAFTDAIEALEKERGNPFPQRKHQKLRGGRPVS
jgi:hypothetical protein